MRKYKCLVYGEEYPIADRRFKCDCGGAFELVHDYEFSKDKIDSAVNSLWRYKELIFIDNENKIITLGEGMTLLIDLQIKDINLYAKVDYMSPASSFKDRGASVLFSLMNELSIKKCVEDSSGNAVSVVQNLYSAGRF